MTSSTPVPEGQYATLHNGYRIHYLDESLGGDGRRPVVVFLHGSGNGACGYSNFKGNIPALVQAGYRVIVPDLIGYGYSDKPDSVDYHLDFFVECVKQALDAIGVDKVTLVGNSLGGAIAAVEMGYLKAQLVESNRRRIDAIEGGEDARATSREPCRRACVTSIARATR